MRRPVGSEARAGVVLDVGASTIRVAVAGRDDVYEAPNAIARTRQGVRRQVLIADQIESQCLDYGGLQLRLPMERGFIVDWAAQKAVWDRALVQVLACPTDTYGALEGRTVIVTEPYFLLPEQQRALDALLFDWYLADAVWRATPAQLAPWAMQPSSDVSLVVDVGHSYTHAVPVVRHTADWRAARRVLTQVLKMMFSYKQWNMMDETYLIEKMKAASCFVAAQASAADENDQDSAPPSRWSFDYLVELFQYVTPAHRSRPDQPNRVAQQYVLPDYATPEDVSDPTTKFGYVLSGPAMPARPAVVPDDQLDAFIADAEAMPARPAGDRQVLRMGQERFQVLEYLFAPDRLGIEQGSLPELVVDVIQRADEEARDMLWSNIVLVGGTARTPGLQRRLYALFQASPHSDAGRFLAARLVRRDEWLRAGGSQAPPGERGGSALGDERSQGWNAK